MTINTWPSTPLYRYNRTLKHRHGIIETDEFASGGDLDRREIRFPKRTLDIEYLVTVANRDTIQNFVRNNSGSAFWFVDTNMASAAKKWVDEYVGRGGPLEIYGALACNNGTYTDETTIANGETTGWVHLLPDPPKLNDAFYFGHTFKFDKITITSVNKLVGTFTIVWEYWNGSAWTAVVGLSDGTSGFTAAPGSQDVTHTPQADWALYEVDDIDAYWIRARVSVASNTSITPFSPYQYQLASHSMITTTSTSATPPTDAIWNPQKVSSPVITFTNSPQASRVYVNTLTYDLHGIGCSNVVVYVDGVTKTAGGVDYTLVSGGGAAGADRITFTAYQTAGSLITADFNGKLRMKGKSSLNDFTEEDVAYNMVKLQATIKEIQW